MKLFVPVLALCLLAVCSSLPVNNEQQITLEAVDANVQGDAGVNHERLVRQFGYGGLGGYGGYPGGYGGYGGYPGGFGGFPIGGGFGGGFGQSQASAQASSSGGGFGGGFGK